MTNHFHFPFFSELREGQGSFFFEGAEIVLIDCLTDLSCFVITAFI